MSQARRTQARHRVTDCVSHVSRHRETGRIKFEDGFNLSKKASVVNPSDLHSVVVEQPVVEPKEKTPDDMRVSSEEESADLTHIAERSQRPTASKPTGRHDVFTHVLEDPDWEVCNFSETTGAPCRNHPEARGDR